MRVAGDNRNYNYTNCRDANADGGTGRSGFNHVRVVQHISVWQDYVTSEDTSPPVNCFCVLYHPAVVGGSTGAAQTPKIEVRFQMRYFVHSIVTLP